MSDKALIIGGGGLIGRSLARRLAAGGTDVDVTVRPGTRWNEASARAVECDLSDRHDVEALSLDHDAVVFLAQSPRFREFPAGASDVIAVNVAAPVEIARRAIENGTKTIVYASSGSVYEPDTSPMRESDPLPAPGVGFYAASKTAAEYALAPFAQHVRLLLLRPFFVFGEHMNPTMLMATLLRSIRVGDPISLRGGDLGLVFQPTCGDDAAHQIATLLTATEVGSATINIAGDRVSSLREVCEILGGIVGRAPVFEHYPGPEQRVIADDTLIRRVAGSSIMSIEEGLTRLAAE